MIALLAAFLDAEPKPSLLRSAFGLWAILAALAIILLIILAAIMATRRARRTRSTTPGGKRRRRAIPDAWSEAGRRIEPIRLDEPEPPTLEEPEEQP